MYSADLRWSALGFSALATSINMHILNCLSLYHVNWSCFLMLWLEWEDTNSIWCVSPSCLQIELDQCNFKLSVNPITSIFQIHLPKWIHFFPRCIKTSLETLPITHCELPQENLNHLPLSLVLNQLTHINLSGLVVSQLSTGHLCLLLKRVIATLRTLELEICRMKVLPAQYSLGFPEPEHLAQKWQWELHACPSEHSLPHSKCKSTDTSTAPCPLGVLWWHGSCLWR